MIPGAIARFWQHRDPPLCDKGDKEVRCWWDIRPLALIQVCWRQVWGRHRVIPYRHGLGIGRTSWVHTQQLTFLNHFFIQSHFQPRNHLISCLWRAQPLSATFLQDILSRLELQLPLRPLHYIALSRCFPRFPWFTYNSKFTSFFQHFYSIHFFSKKGNFSVFRSLCSL